MSRAYEGCIGAGGNLIRIPVQHSSQLYNHGRIRPTLDMPKNMKKKGGNTIRIDERVPPDQSGLGIGYVSLMTIQWEV